MEAQDTLNGLIQKGIDSGPDYEAAVKKVQEAQSNAATLGGDPMAGAMQKRRRLSRETNWSRRLTDLIAALDDLQAPPPIEIQIADAAAMAEIQRIKDIIDSRGLHAVVDRRRHRSAGSGEGLRLRYPQQSLYAYGNRQ